VLGRTASRRFINSLLTKKASVSRIYLAPDANTLLVTMERCLATTGHINLVVGGKQPMPQWLDLDAARAHCRAGAGVSPWACSNGDPVIFAFHGYLSAIHELPHGRRDPAQERAAILAEAYREGRDPEAISGWTWS